MRHATSADASEGAFCSFLLLERFFCSCTFHFSALIEGSSREQSPGVHGVSLLVFSYINQDFGRDPQVVVERGKGCPSQKTPQRRGGGSANSVHWGSVQEDF